jgi:hypothetical protein
VIIEEDAGLRRQALDLLRHEYQLNEQRPGLHQSELTSCLTKAFRARTELPSPSTDKEALLFSIGFMFERVMLASEVTPKEIVVDGISCSLDTIELFGPADTKTTRMRAAGRKGEDGFQLPPGWLMQAKTYRYALNKQRELDRLLPEYSFSFVVLHIIEPELSAWTLNFTAEELEDHWSWMLTRQSQLDSLLAANDAQPFLHNQDWECVNCHWKLTCELEASINAPALPQPIPFPFTD